MKFCFNLESVLRFRERLEEEAHMAHMQAKRAVDQLLGQIDEMYRQIDRTRESAAEQALHSTDSSHLQMLQEFIEGQKIMIDRARQKARELLMIAEEKQDALRQAAQAKKALVKLKERRFLEFKKQQKVKDMKQIDEVVTTRIARGGMK